MIKLTKTQPTRSQMYIHAEGRLEAQAVGQLRALIEAAPPHAITIDLGGLISLDPDGRDLLLSLRAAGGRLQGGSLYINQLLSES